MSVTFLDKIIGITREKVGLQKRRGEAAEVIRNAEKVRTDATPYRFRAALGKNGRNNIIAEIKRSSPSKGIINDEIDAVDVACCYEKGGAAAISVLTEGEFFGGSLDDLRNVRRATELPLLRKDFTVDEFQIYEAAAAGADCVLLIVAALSEAELRKLLGTAHELSMDALVEVHDENEMETALAVGVDIIGVNNRNLHSLDVSLDVSRDLIRRRPNDVLMVAESGLSSRDELDELRELGFDGFLIGETLMRSKDAAETLRRFV